MPSGPGDTYWYAVGAGNFGWLANPLFLLHWRHTFRCGYCAAYCSQLSSTRWEWWSPGIIPTDRPPVVVLVLLCLMLKSWWFWILDMINRSYSTARYEFGCLVSQKKISAEHNIRTVGLTTAGATPHVWFWWCWVPLPECHDESGQTCGQLPCWNCTGCKSEAGKVHHPGWDFARVCKSGRWWTVQSHRYLP